MNSETPRNKIDAIYELRDAVEAKTRAEVALEATGSEKARDALLDAQLNVETKTQDAIDVCHDCGHSHPFDAGHMPRITTGGGEYPDNVIAVDFRRDAEGA